jgi:hypothetical protein
MQRQLPSEPEGTETPCKVEEERRRGQDGGGDEALRRRRCRNTQSV